MMLVMRSQGKCVIFFIWINSMSWILESQEGSKLSLLRLQKQAARII